MLQIKGTFYRTYTDAVLNYNAEDEVSRAVDNLQQRVSHGFPEKTPPSLLHYLQIFNLALLSRRRSERHLGNGPFEILKLCLKANVVVFQMKLRCCGVYNYTSWFGSVYYPSNGIPTSCCLNASDCNQGDLRNATAAPSKVYHQVRLRGISLAPPVKPSPSV